MGVGFGYESNTQDFVDLETKEVATKAIRDELLSVDQKGKIIDHSTGQQSKIMEKSERKENRSQSALFIMLSVIMLVLLAITVTLNIKDIKLKNSGTAIEVDCKEGNTITGKYNGRPAEVSYLNNYGKMKLTYKSDNGTTTTGSEIYNGCAIKDNNENIYLINPSKTMFSTNIKEKITVYYDNNIKSARTLTSIWFWVGVYCLLILLLTLFLRFTYITLHKTKHSKVS
jgi:hypothetical protein